jgi:hypothetical protein
VPTDLCGLAATAPLQAGVRTGNTLPEKRRQSARRPCPGPDFRTSRPRNASGKKYLFNGINALGKMTTLARSLQQNSARNPAAAGDAAYDRAALQAGFDNK